MVTDMDAGKVYFIMGSTGSGRREIVADLIEGGLPQDRPAVVAHADTEPQRAPLEPVKEPENAVTVTYKTLVQAPSAPEGGVLFLMAPGDGNPADAIESFRQWYRNQPSELARILAVVDCRLGAEAPTLAPWFDCLVHFADAVLLKRREDISPKWPQDFVKKFQSAKYPCLFEYVKKGRVGNPARVLDTVPRRMALIFDDIDAVDQMAIDPDNLPDEPIDLVAPEDPWLARYDSGKRVKPLPDIRPFLAGR